MIMHMTIHHPHPDRVELLIDAMHQFQMVVSSKPGVLSVHTLRDTSTGALVELAVWSTKEAWLEAQQTMSQSEGLNNLTELETAPPIVYHLEEI